MLKVVGALLVLVVMLSVYQNIVIMKQRELIGAMMRNPACLMPVPMPKPVIRSAGCVLQARGKLIPIVPCPTLEAQ